jgi:hypothetical protein
MGRWRRKLLLSLIVYCAGFATAVYVLAPSSAQASETTHTAAAAGWSANAETWIDKAQTSQWTGKLKTGMDKFVSFAEDNALRAAEMIRSHTGQSDQSE